MFLTIWMNAVATKTHKHPWSLLLLGNVCARNKWPLIWQYWSSFLPLTILLLNFRVKKQEIFSPAAATILPALSPVTSLEESHIIWTSIFLQWINFPQLNKPLHLSLIPDIYKNCNSLIKFNIQLWIWIQPHAWFLLFLSLKCNSNKPTCTTQKLKKLQWESELISCPKYQEETKNQTQPNPKLTVFQLWNLTNLNFFGTQANTFPSDLKQIQISLSSHVNRTAHNWCKRENHRRKEKEAKTNHKERKRKSTSLHPQHLII